MTDLDSSTDADDPAASDILFAPWDGRRVPVTLVGGYLGSGKTTAINEMLAHTSRRIAVLVNDAGPVNIDASLVRSRQGDTIELTNGCICCSLTEGLAAAFSVVTARDEAPDHLVIELSGIADPSRVVAWANSPGFRHDSTIVLVDADRIHDLTEDEVTRPHVAAQISAADLLVITKFDLVEPSARVAVRDLVSALAPTTPTIDAESSSDLGALLDLASRHPNSAVALPPPRLFDPHVISTVPIPRPTDDDSIASLLDGLEPDVIRAKGIAEMQDGERRLIQLVGRRRSITKLPAAEDELPTDLVVISLRR